MKYNEVAKGIFIERPNRFIAKVLLNGNIETVHVKNTGRCRELLVEGCTVYLAAGVSGARKTKYDLIAVEKLSESGETKLINMDSQAPNEAVHEWLCSGELFGIDAGIRREVKHGESRFDIFIEYEEKKAFLEVKGVTLEENGLAMFPDAPTERGVKHINELIHAVEDGYEAYILFVIQMKGVHSFSPNYNTHKELGEALKRAERAGVKILAYDCVVTENSMKISEPIKIVL